MRPSTLPRSLGLALPLLAACAAPPPAAPTPRELTPPGVSLALRAPSAPPPSPTSATTCALDVRGTDQVPGESTLEFWRRAGAGALVVDYRGPLLQRVEANGREVRDFVWANGHVVVPAAYLRAGENRLRFRFTSRMAAAGASIIRYQEPEEPGRGGDTYLYTLLVPADANQLFPAFDQPDLKAVFRLELLAPAGWRVLANAPVQDTSAAPDGVTWRFAPTRPISTYLAAFAAGPWARWEDAPPGERSVTLYARRARAGEVDADTLLAPTAAPSSGWRATSRSPTPSRSSPSCSPPPSPSAGWSTRARSSTTSRASSSASRPRCRSAWAAARRSTTRWRTSGSATW